MNKQIHTHNFFLCFEFSNAPCLGRALPHFVPLFTIPMCSDRDWKTVVQLLVHWHRLRNNMLFQDCLLRKKDNNLKCSILSKITPLLDSWFLKDHTVTAHLKRQAQSQLLQIKREKKGFKYPCWKSRRNKTKQSKTKPYLLHGADLIIFFIISSLCWNQNRYKSLSQEQWFSGSTVIWDAIQTDLNRLEKWAGWT